jgi:hypothetical protein
MSLGGSDEIKHTVFLIHSKAAPVFWKTPGKSAQGSAPLSKEETWQFRKEQFNISASKGKPVLP